LRTLQAANNNKSGFTAMRHVALEEAEKLSRGQRKLYLWTITHAWATDRKITVDTTSGVCTFRVPKGTALTTIHDICTVMCIDSRAFMRTFSSLSRRRLIAGAKCPNECDRVFSGYSYVPRTDSYVWSSIILLVSFLPDANPDDFDNWDASEWNVVSINTRNPHKDRRGVKFQCQQKALSSPRVTKKAAANMANCFIEGVNLFPMRANFPATNCLSIGICEGTSPSMIRTSASYDADIHPDGCMSSTSGDANRPTADDNFPKTASEPVVYENNTSKNSFLEANLLEAKP
jgi:hypothetical protein